MHVLQMDAQLVRFSKAGLHSLGSVILELAGHFSVAKEHLLNHRSNFEQLTDKHSLGCCKVLKQQCWISISNRAIVTNTL